MDYSTLVTTISAAVSASSLVVGGTWAYFKFFKEQPYITRSNLVVTPTLVEEDGADLMKIQACASALGKARLTFARGDPEENPFVAVYPITKDMARDWPAEWTNPVAATEVFISDEYIEAGETLRDVALLWIGRRQRDVTGYRVEFSLTVTDPELSDEKFSWHDVQVVSFNPRARTETEG